MKFPSGRFISRTAQRGVSLIVVLISLLIMSFAAVALLRSTDTATLMRRQPHLQENGAGLRRLRNETAITWLTGNLTGTTLHADITANGYYSRSAGNLRPHRPGNTQRRDRRREMGRRRGECQLPDDRRHGDACQRRRRLRHLVRDQPRVQRGR